MSSGILSCSPLPDQNCEVVHRSLHLVDVLTLDTEASQEGTVRLCSLSFIDALHELEPLVGVGDGEKTVTANRLLLRGCDEPTVPRAFSLSRAPPCRFDPRVRDRSEANLESDPFSFVFRFGEATCRVGKVRAASRLAFDRGRAGSLGA